MVAGALVPNQGYMSTGEVLLFLALLLVLTYLAFQSERQLFPRTIVVDLSCKAYAVISWQ